MSFAPRSLRPLVSLAACSALLVASRFLVPRCAAQQPTPAPASASTPPRAKTPGQVAISPDSTLVAWTLRQKQSSTLHLTALPAATGVTEKLISPPGDKCANTAPVWSPDSQTLAFLSTCGQGPEKPGQEEIFLWSRQTGQLQQLTHLTGQIHEAAWSPDGKSIAFLFVENATRSAGALDAMKPWSGVIGEDGVEVQRVYNVDAATGQGRWITPLTLHVYEFDWAPSSREIAYIAADAPGSNNWWIAQLWAAPVSDAPDAVAAQPRSVVDTAKLSGPLHGLQIAVPRWSPDGKRIAFVGGLMSDQGSTGGDIWVVNADSDDKPGNPVDITPGIDGTPCFEGWISDHTVSFVENRRGHTLLSAYNINSDTVVPGAPLDLGEVSVSGGPIKDAISVSDRRSGSKERTIAFVESSFNQPPEVYVGRPDALQPITHLNENLKPESKTISLEWDNEGFHVQGWLTFPDNYDPAKTYPIIVQVHGGPSAAINSRWGGSSWASDGYFEFEPNPRGSFGQGEKFTEANRKDFGYGDLRDILKGMDVIEAKYPVDKHREGITGWSYGGYMTMFAVTQTHRFRAAVAGAGLSDWLSYYGENSIDRWMIPFFGASVYDDPAVYAKSSPITFIKNVKTPTLVIVGDRDGECPAPQSFEFWHALRDLGVKTRLVVYPDEGHGFRNPAHIKDRAEREKKWFGEYMPAG